MFRDQIRALQKVLQKQFVASDKSTDVDVVVVCEEGGLVCVNLAMIRGGRHLGDRAHFPVQAEEGTPVEILGAFIDQHYRDHPPPTKLLVSLHTPDELNALQEDCIGQGLNLARARGESERAWLEMAQKNASLALRARLSDRSRAQERLEALALSLSMAEPPERIECFDISHTMGEAPVASCVVCVSGQMKNADYRRYNITGVLPGDDYGAMREVLTRRYEKIAAGQGVCPDLILIDGGKGQVNIAQDVLNEVGLDGVPVVGVAKGEDRRPGLESLIFPQSGRAPLQLSQDHPALHLIQEIRDEAHRFALTGHRARRAKSRRTSSLEDIPGVGPARRKRLLSQFGGIAGLKAATVDDLCRVPGISLALAKAIHESFR
jgi:excinuclease ABC subunit C